MKAKNSGLNVIHWEFFPEKLKTDSVKDIIIEHAGAYDLNTKQFIGVRLKWKVYVKNNNETVLHYLAEDVYIISKPEEITIDEVNSMLNISKERVLNEFTVRAHLKFPLFEIPPNLPATILLLLESESRPKS